MESSWYDKWERAFLRSKRRNSINSRIYPEALEALHDDIWLISHPGETMASRPDDVLVEGGKKRAFHLTKNDREFARAVGIRTASRTRGSSLRRR
jgi:hypothetical protein